MAAIAACRTCGTEALENARFCHGCGSPIDQGPSRADLRNRKRLQKLRRQEASEQREIDAILAKVSAKGMQSLTFWEKRALHKATEHQRQRDAELSKPRARY